MQTKVKISKDGRSQVFTLDMVELFLQLAGGGSSAGLSTVQTATAIDMSREFFGAGKIEFNGFLLVKL